MILRLPAIFALCLALLLAQWAGWQHRFAHADGVAVAVGCQALADDNACSAEGTAHHDCKLFDHASHAEGAQPGQALTRPVASPGLPRMAMLSMSYALQRFMPPAHGPPVLV